jgi:hypothetical protein
MSEQELLERIENLNSTIITKMSFESLARLTHGFKEQLVRALIIRGTTNREQREIIAYIRNAFRSWKKDTDIFWGAMPQYEVYPEYMERLQLDIECDLVLTADGFVSDSQPKERANQWFPGLLALAQQHNKVNNITTVEKQKEDKRLADAKKRIAQLESAVERLKAENAQYKEQSTSLGVSIETEEKLTTEEVWTMRERLVFFFSILCLDNDKKYTVFSNLEKFIKEICNDQKNIVPFISRMKRPEEASANAKAAKKVASLMKLIIPQEYRMDEQLTINKLIKSMLENFPEEDEE